MRSERVYNRCRFAKPCIQAVLSGDYREDEMNWKSRFALGVLTALAMMLLTYALPRGGTLNGAALVQFPLTVGVWAIFVLLFVKLK